MFCIEPVVVVKSPVENTLTLQESGECAKPESFQTENQSYPESAKSHL